MAKVMVSFSVNRLNHGILIGVSYNGITTVSKTVYVSSILTAPANLPAPSVNRRIRQPSGQQFNQVRGVMVASFPVKKPE